ncbi:hypothetical protein BGX31_004562 [Mortierella sp. GBA43]|nr:hypothetical protein BGX31_004562 [Mortierella sp. GBA43]
MLALCPNLRMLTVDPGDNQPDIEDNTDPCWPGTVDDAGQPKESRIRKLVLKGVKVEQSSLERILSRCPHLRTLKLIGLLQGQTGLFDRVQFFTTLSTSCSLLESFHLSFHDSCMTIGDTSALIQTFFPTIGSMGRDDEGIQETPRQQTHKFTTMSLYHEDFNQDVYRQLLHLYNYPYYIPNTLTSLEILCSSSPVNSIFVSNKIHDFLCSAPTLLHLIAPQVQFFSEHLDLNGTAVKNEPEYLYPRLCKRGRPVSQFHWVRRKMWACRGLRTLQLKFVAMEADYPSAENARIMFGYIARACPELRDLAIERKALDLTYKGGMCLLARLRHLERLTILTYTRVKLEKKDLEWMGREPAKRFTLPWRKRKPKTSQPQSYTITRGNRNVGSDDNSVSSGGTSENELWTLDDMKQVGTTAELDACQKEIAERGCWPKLMFLGLQHAPMGRGRPIKVEEYLTELAYDIRPDIQFSCDSKQWWD